jgi:hypothetical protein
MIFIVIDEEEHYESHPLSGSGSLKIKSHNQRTTGSSYFKTIKRTNSFTERTGKDLTVLWLVI